MGHTRNRVNEGESRGSQATWPYGKYLPAPPSPELHEASRCFRPSGQLRSPECTRATTFQLKPTGLASERFGDTRDYIKTIADRCPRKTHDAALYQPLILAATSLPGELLQGGRRLLLLKTKPIDTRGHVGLGA